MLIICAVSCTTEVGQSGNQAKFGIYETVNSITLTGQVMNKLAELHVQAADPSEAPVIGYIASHNKSWRDSISVIAVAPDVRVVVTARAEGETGQYALVAVKDSASVGIADIREAVNQGDRVEIHFTLKGARKWAKMTGENLNRQVAFVVDDLVYNLPYVAAPIRSGEALITGLDAVEAERITRLLNGDLQL